jgi:hypothetical protein
MREILKFRIAQKKVGRKGEGEREGGKEGGREGGREGGSGGSQATQRRG